MQNLRDFHKNISESKTALVGLLRDRSLLTDGPYTLRSGELSNWYLDGRRTTMDGHGATLVARCVLGVLDPGVTAIGGMTMGADPIAVATAVVAHEAGISLRAFSVRKEAKAHGMGGRIVGPLEEGEAVTVLEDTTSTGAAFIESIIVMQNGGHPVVQAIAVADRSNGSVAKQMAELEIPYVALITPEDLLHSA
ncbi:MAG: orotate phosphoribosyltransferase [Acidimicrobiia bacterium]|nr:orotate phosphoribosyltransferase [Acidimicrobiia bacterium]MBT8192945.1 orotate phosphoribosyltransferase [Acidimicrobiia bacterium]MBT8246765.1 orotate phosphoribosyltransferase [Acidimicrobiia bacterium]NNF87948.1 orotate phosphoribosyltransferase [Acidimicrobiia bacterium]NNJ47796.1 orotate phosphoribosyltransferase [Acidimicrobiia bacterium]